MKHQHLGQLRGEYVFGWLQFKQKVIKKNKQHVPAQPEAPLMNRPEFVNAPVPDKKPEVVISNQRQTRIDSHQAHE